MDRKIAMMILKFLNDLLDETKRIFIFSAASQAKRSFPILSNFPTFYHPLNSLIKSGC
jgi:hypothetical protein